MGISPKLELRQSQALVMTPQLQQAIKLLQMSNLELADYVDQELEQNPLLERNDGDAAANQPDDGAPRAEAAAEPAEGAVDTPPAADSQPDTEYDNLFANDGPGDGAGQDLGSFASISSSRGGSFDDDNYNFDQTASNEQSLQQHLLAQLQMEVSDPIDRAIGADLIVQFDEAGYLREPLSAAASRLGCDVARVERVLAAVQGLDPAGIGARDLAECLALQLKERDRYDPAMQAFIANLDLLGKGDMARLKAVCGVDGEDLADMIREVRRLDPKPGLAFDRPISQTVVPDVFVRPHPEGGWRIELNSDTLPKVLVNTRYYTRVAKQLKDRTERNFIAERLAAANWLVKSLDQRAQTVLKVASEIVRQQDGFFAHGVQHLRPLNLRTVAEAVELHESTVSRVTTSKSMATPRGIFDFKYFFTAALTATDGGDALSAEAVRQRIRQMIDNENPADPLSDDALVDALRQTGANVARRTVAKYREAMRIPSSLQRRRLRSLKELTGPTKK
jgi:RNA polymerase sigma-54 factor